MPIIKTDLKLFDDEYKNKVFVDCFNNTYDTTLKHLENGDYFVITGDIPAMWLRDSSAQVMHYLHFVDEENVRNLIKGILAKQFEQIITDPYANAFMEDENHESMWAKYVKTDYHPKIVWERKFELDSLCYPLFLLTKYYKKTNDIEPFNKQFLEAFDIIIKTVRTEQHHHELSSYFFYIKDPWGTAVQDVGKNTNPEEEKGLVWSGFRPSDDMCKYNYHIPDNMFLVSVLHSLSPIFENVLKDENRSKICDDLVNELRPLIEKYGVAEVDGLGKIYVSETNCLGKWHADDDANVPSLLSIPYLEYPYMDAQIYANTRKYILSSRNKFYFEGKILHGIGSPHTPKDMVWTIALSMQGLTSNDEKEKEDCLNMLFETSKADGLMHEGVDVNDINKFTRPWFAWANSLFAEFILSYIKK